MKEKLCPLCSKPVRSDALAKQSCKLCGMFIEHSETQFIYDVSAGDSFFFCCERCMKTYIKTYEKIENKIIIVEDIYEDISVEQHNEDVCMYYSKFVQEYAYLPALQVSEQETEND